MATPAGWYPDPSGTAQQRYFDGQQWTEHYAGYASLPPPPPPPPPSSVVTQSHPASADEPVSSNQRILFLGGILVALFLIAWIGGGFDGEESASSTASSAVTSTTRAAVPTPNQPAPTIPKAPPAGLNQEVRDGKFAFVVTSIDSSTVAGDPSNQFMREEAQGVFVNVHMTVTNIGDRPQTFFADNQKLIIEGREYSAHTMAAVWTGASNVEVNPGNSIAAVVSFDVPNPPEGPKINAVELHDSAFSGGVTVYPR